MIKNDKINMLLCSWVNPIPSTPIWLPNGSLE